MVAVLALGIACSASSTPEEIATDAAREWTDESVDDVADNLAEFVLGEVPLLSPLGGELVEIFLDRSIDWTYGSPRQYGNALYDVVTTASVDFEVDIPIVGAKSYTISLPFTIRVNTDRMSVVDADADFLGARVNEGGS
ncbi:MAG: hypothetical protein J4F43_08640 [Dehalococcoidia bacterium]|nr:hypothetical protein [Dehalococcoidia bacterium]